jgi:hypothetical protein
VREGELKPIKHNKAVADRKVSTAFLVFGKGCGAKKGFTALPFFRGRQPKSKEQEK